ncbi:trypsin-1-like [Arctopsyche grandis]|uniref:trypsin-1-like n=1 Tax=Arctopsyche grandis TaxID=121162 RepID=UPI00406D84B4
MDTFLHQSKVPLFIILLYNLNNVKCQTDGMSLMGLAVQGFNPCPDGFIFAQREIGRRPSVENYWDGTFNLKTYKNLSEARIELRLDSPAIITMDPEIARVYSQGLLFRVIPFDGKNDISFNVQGVQGQPFPNIVNAALNGKPVCQNATKMEPTILGAQPIALGSFTPSPENFIPFCGRRQIDHTELILRGQNTRPGDWPWHVALYGRNRNVTNPLSYRCGGSIVSDKAILTAAHCVTTSEGDKLPRNALLAMAGKYNLNKRDKSVQELRLSSVILPDGFDRNNLRNDIAILRLRTRIIFNQYVQPICLWTDYDISRNVSKNHAYGLNGTIVGWGLNENDTASQQLMTGTMTIVSDTECLLSYASFFDKFVYENSLCAGGQQTIGSSPCNGDSGGGLVVPVIQSDKKISYFLRGIVSVTVSRSDKKVCDPQYFTVFTDAAKYIDWIKSNK